MKGQGTVWRSRNPVSPRNSRDRGSQRESQVKVIVNPNPHHQMGYFIYKLKNKQSSFFFFFAHYKASQQRCKVPGMNRRRQQQPTPVLLPGKSHGWRSLIGHSPWGCEESDRTEQIHFHFSLSCIGEGNGNPLQYSCLENPRDGGARWAAIYGVAQSWTQLT